MIMENVINEVQVLLSYNNEWVERYKKYAEKMKGNMGFFEENRKKFYESRPLHFYITTTNAKNSTNLILDMRYGGQSVATLKANKENISLYTVGKDENNYRDFNCEIKLDKNIKWGDTNASKFRSFFKNRDYSRNKTNNNKRNEEHFVEHLLLTEFSKRNANDKPILGIQPIKFCGIRFGIPTPISASDHKKVTYAYQMGGGIDILARTGRGKHSTYLTVIEVKDENIKQEPPKEALKQAIQYAVFIRELLRSEIGKDWYEIFGFKGNIPKNLTIRVACAMPYKDDNDMDKSFEKSIYPIGNDKIECHYIYFQYDGKKIDNFHTSLTL
jgi:hypothetical protein